MDDEIADAISRLLLVSGGSEQAKEYLEAYTERDESSISTPSSLRGLDLRRSPSAVILPPRLSLHVTDPWREDDGTPAEFAASVGSRYSSHLSPSREMWFNDRHSSRGNTTHHATESHELADWLANNPTRTGLSPPVTPVRVQSYRPKVPVHTRGTPPPPSPAISVPSQVSDQPSSVHNFSSTSGPEHEPVRLTRPARKTAQPPLSASGVRRSRRISGRPPPHGDRVPDVTDLHPDLALVSGGESLLSSSEFEIVKSKIRADPEYVGELPYIRLLNPQYKVKTLVYHPPVSGTGKWYQVSKGKAVGVFTDWGLTAAATQGVTKAIFKSYPTRGEAIVAYQTMLLRGEVLLMNEYDAGEAERK